LPDTAAEFSGECHDVMATSMRDVAALESCVMHMHACTAGERLGCHFLPLPLQTAVSAAAHVFLGPWDVLRMACARQREGSQRGTQRESERFTRGDISLVAPREKKRMLCLSVSCVLAAYARCLFHALPLQRRQKLLRALQPPASAPQGSHRARRIACLLPPPKKVSSGCRPSSM